VQDLHVNSAHHRRPKLSKRRSVPSLFERQLINWSTSNFKASTIVQYQSAVRCFEQSLTPRRLDAATRGDVIAYVVSCAEPGRGRALAALHGFLEYLVNRRKLPSDPSAGITIADSQLVLSRDEVQRLLLADGMLAVELRRLTWGNAVVRLISPARHRALSSASRDGLLLLFRERFSGRDLLRDLGPAADELIF
jgi:hypothetical protein